MAMHRFPASIAALALLGLRVLSWDWIRRSLDRRPSWDVRQQDARIVRGIGRRATALRMHKASPSWLIDRRRQRQAPAIGTPFHFDQRFRAPVTRPVHGVSGGRRPWIPLQGGYTRRSVELVVESRPRWQMQLRIRDGLKGYLNRLFNGDEPILDLCR